MLAEQLLDGATQDSGIAVVSAPSVFVKLKQLMVRSSHHWIDRARAFILELTGLDRIKADGKHDTQPAVWLLEFDRRFDILPGFVYYDFNRPLQLPGLPNPGSRSVCISLSDCHQ